MPPIPASQNPNLIKVFKPHNPDQPLYADQRQINDLDGKLIKWEHRDTWLANAAKAKGPRKAATKADEALPSGLSIDAETGVISGTLDTVIPKLANPGRTKADLLAEAAAKGVAVTKRMTVAQLEAALAAA